jgi:5-amino-6-(5-phospho-D-ribitylamino)uracil phosphatase
MRETSVLARETQAFPEDPGLRFADRLSSCSTEMDARSFGMIALDVDGTTLNPRGLVSPRTRTAIHACIDAGLAITFATGRNWTETKSILTDLDFAGPCVFVGGANVIDTASSKTIFCKRMDAQLARDLCHAVESFGHAACALQQTETAGVDYLISDGVGLSGAMSSWLAVTAATHHKIPRGELAKHAHEHTIRVGVVAEPPAIALLQEELDHRFFGRIMRHAIHVPTKGVDVLEAFDPHVSKWDGICRVASSLGIQGWQIVAIGDDVNDIPMLTSAGLGVAMGNARPAAKAAAKRVIGSNAEDGLAVFLENLLAGRIIGTANAL